MTTREKPRGQAMVEFALVIPVFLLLMVALFDFGRVIWVNDTLATAAREAVRYAIVHGGADSQTCPVGPPAPGVTIPPASTACPYPSPSRQAIKDLAQQYAAGNSTDATAPVWHGAVPTWRHDTAQP